MTPQAYLYICDGDIDSPVLTHNKMDWPEKYPHWQEIPLFMAQPEQKPVAVGRWPSAAIGKETLQDALKRENTTPTQPEQEPVAWVRKHELPLAPGDAFSWVETFVHKTPLYTTPPQRKPLTDEEIDALPWTKTYEGDVTLLEALRDFARAIEATHGIKGEA